MPNETKGIVFEVISGAEGPCLSVGENPKCTGYRLAGPKPWGGGRIRHTFVVDDKAGLMQLKHYVDKALEEFDAD